MAATTSVLGNLIDILVAFRPVDMQTAANNGDWVSLKNATGVLILFHSAIGTGGDDPTLTVNQATDNAGTSSKALNLPSGANTLVWKKQAVTDLTSTAAWSNASADVSNNTWTNATSAEQEALVAVELPADLLDVDNGFTHIQAAVADVGTNAQLGACYYVLYGLRYPARPDQVVSPIA